MNTLKKGTFDANYPISELKQSLVNRDIVENHLNNFAKKLDKFGWLSPIIIDDKGNIIEGHHRVLSAEKLKLNSVPVYIVDWVNTSDLNEYQKYIISLNNSNRAWGALDYLKSFSRNKDAYEFVYQKYIDSNGVFSVGNILNIYFNCGTSQEFKEGRSTIKDLKFSEYLNKNFLRLKSKYGGKKFQAFTINRVCSFVHQKIKGNEKEMDYMFIQLEELAKSDNAILSSVEMIRPWLNTQLKAYRTK
jgi:hypothetical protein